LHVHVYDKINDINDYTHTAASTFAGDSSFGLESIDMMLKTMLSTCTNQDSKYDRLRERKKINSQPNKK
jgi:hypothetical protein